VRIISPRLRNRLAAAAVLEACATAAFGQPAEVQINLCSEPGAIIKGLDLRADDRLREAWYFETAGLALFQRGIVLRLRLADRKPELTLKVAGQDCARVDPALLPRGEGKCEYDLHGADFKGAVSLSRRLDEAAVRELLDGRTPVGKVLSEAQIRYLRERLSAWPLPPDVAPLGPVHVRAYRPPDRRFIVEMWQLPDGERYVEISLKTQFEEAERRRSELETALARAGVAVCADQSSQAGAKLRVLAPPRR
jgi:hypothetical protein